MARRQINVKVLENGTKTFEVRHRWEDRPVPPPPDGTPVEYLPFRQQVRGAPGLHGRPDWLKAKVPDGGVYRDIKETMRGLNLHTVCEEARCPNIGECWNNRTATFMILGNVCTRSCGFCAVLTGKPTELDLDEPHRVADAAKKMGLEHAVITSVNRDELADGGASIFAAVIREIREQVPGCAVEVLTPDFKGNRDAIRTVIDAAPSTFNHNIETVPRLYPAVRPQAKFKRSLEVLRYAKELNPDGLTKSGFMVGLGEVEEEIHQTMRDLRDHDVDILTIGQYLRPSENHLPMSRYYRPKEFADLRKYGFSLGFRHVESGPLVRSSYHAHEQTTDARRGVLGGEGLEERARKAVISTDLTRLLGVRHPIVSAPMAGWSGGELAGAVSTAGAFGMIGVGSATPTGWISGQAQVARQHGPFGVGLMSWALERRPELLDAVLAERPAAVSLSFGDPAPYVERVREAGAVVMSQVQDAEKAEMAIQAGVDVLVAQGTDAGGHTGRVGTMPLLQKVLEIGERAGTPVLAAGGIGTGRAVAGVLAMGASGAWIGTRFCATAESTGTDEAKRLILNADETATVHTRVFDLVQGIPWPEEFAGRAIRNSFSDRWHGREAQLEEQRSSVSSEFEATRGDYAEDFVYAGQAAGLVEDLPAAGELVGRLMVEAEARLKACGALLGETS